MGWNESSNMVQQSREFTRSENQLKVLNGNLMAEHNSGFDLE